MNYSSLLSTVLISQLIISCSETNSCAETGDNLFENLKRLKNLSSQLRLPIQEFEAAIVVGAAEAVSQREKSKVQICLRAKSSDITEFRVLSSNGKVLESWREIFASKPAP